MHMDVKFINLYGFIQDFAYLLATLTTKEDTNMALENKSLLINFNDKMTNPTINNNLDGMRSLNDWNHINLSF